MREKRAVIMENSIRYNIFNEADGFYLAYIDNKAKTVKITKTDNLEKAKEELTKLYNDIGIKIEFSSTISSLQILKNRGYEILENGEKMYNNQIIESDFEESAVLDHIIAPKTQEKVAEENRRKWKVIRRVSATLGASIILVSATIGISRCIDKNKNQKNNDTTTPTTTPTTTVGAPTETTPTMTSETEVVVPTEFSEEEIIERVPDPRMEELKIQYENGELSFDLSNPEVLATKFQEFYKHFEGSTVSSTEALVYFLALNDMRIDGYDFTVVDQYINKVNLAITQYQGVEPEFSQFVASKTDADFINAMVKPMYEYKNAVLMGETDEAIVNKAIEYFATITYGIQTLQPIYPNQEKPEYVVYYEQLSPSQKAVMSNLAAHSLNQPANDKKPFFNIADLVPAIQLPGIHLVIDELTIQAIFEFYGGPHNIQPGEDQTTDTYLGEQGHSHREMTSFSNEYINSVYCSQDLANKIAEAPKTIS